MGWHVGAAGWQETRINTEAPPVVIAVKPDSAGAKMGVPVKGAILEINGSLGCANAGSMIRVR